MENTNLKKNRKEFIKKAFKDNLNSVEDIDAGHWNDINFLIKLKKININEFNNFKISVGQPYGDPVEQIDCDFNDFFNDIDNKSSEIIKNRIYHPDYIKQENLNNIKVFVFIQKINGSYCLYASFQ
ncbi:hypothetical protein M3M35_06425 [Fructilactobacillus myrtifloralis]|uniref:Uncharacterized protein n=1 Tax=Fructilactobacillus myrtifloralis TaxID=2940301 RepID=A0ABY5BRA6_9LACO|nr:hypothetical protein [Fructilactobacillus myrtifloralis]USS84924.1 hypothetical protein M3M35_06425 [Fructilactobacillus myrtifloralis]